jgi:hypothetical protein
MLGKLAGPQQGIQAGDPLAGFGRSRSGTNRGLKTLGPESITPFYRS